jgi:ribonuclease HII
MLETTLISSFPHAIIATDEVGRGPLSGPVVVGAIRLEVPDLSTLKKVLSTLAPLGVTDSKKLSAQKRGLILQQLGVRDLPFRHSGEVVVSGVRISYVSWEMGHEVIDGENILGASLRGMKEASLFLHQGDFARLKGPECTVLIDGKMKLRWGENSPPWREIPLVQGDSRSLLIGLSSLIAKEKRDRYMLGMHELYPVYGFNTHFGYPTRAHRQAIIEHGPSPIHRKSFKGVKEHLAQ